MKISLQEIIKEYTEKGKCIRCGANSGDDAQPKILCARCRTEINCNGSGDFQTYVLWHWFRSKCKKYIKKAKQHK